MSYPGPVMPTEGAGSVAGFGPRLLAFFIDGALSVLIAVLAGFRPGHRGYGLVVYFAFLAIELLFVTFAGQTPGMRAAGVVVVRGSDGGKPRRQWGVGGTVVLAAIVPALVPGARGGSLLDRATRTTVVAAPLS